MSDPFRKVRAGEPLRIAAETFNTFIDAGLDFRRRQRSITSSSFPIVPNHDIVLVRNETGDARKRFEIVGIDRPIILPSRNLAGFQDQLAFVGVAPNEDDHLGKFAVLLEPLPDGGIGRACLSGVCHVRINVADAAHQFADVETDSPEGLLTRECGSAFILWKEEGEYGEYGEYGEDDPGSGYEGEYYGYGELRWALVRLSNFCPKEEEQEEWETV